MEVGEPVIYALAVPDSADKCAVGCDSGKFVVIEVESNHAQAQFTYPDPIIKVCPSSDSVFYVVSEQAVYLHDIREPAGGKEICRPNAEIYDFTSIDNIFALSTDDETVVVSNGRILRKTRNAGILPSVCNSLAFKTRNQLLAGYIDSSIGLWDIKARKFSSLQQITTSGVNSVHSIASHAAYTAAGCQNGLAIYNEKKLEVFAKFDHEGPVHNVIFAPCFDSKVTVSGSADGTLMALDIANRKIIGSLSIENEKIQSISSNSKFIAVSDTSDTGNITIFLPDDFKETGEEEDRS